MSEFVFSTHSNSLQREICWMYSLTQNLPIIIYRKISWSEFIVRRDSSKQHFSSKDLRKQKKVLFAQRFYVLGNLGLLRSSMFLFRSVSGRLGECLDVLALEFVHSDTRCPKTCWCSWLVCFLASWQNLEKVLFLRILLNFFLLFKDYKYH